jgi:hypothetical protein
MAERIRSPYFIHVSGGFMEEEGGRNATNSRLARTVSAPPLYTNVDTRAKTCFHEVARQKAASTFIHHFYGSSVGNLSFKQT